MKLTKSNFYIKMYKGDNKKLIYFSLLSLFITLNIKFNVYILYFIIT